MEKDVREGVKKKLCGSDLLNDRSEIENLFFAGITGLKCINKSDFLQDAFYFIGDWSKRDFLAFVEEDADTVL